MKSSPWRYPSPVEPLPVPRQARAADTVRAAVEATTDLLDRLPETHVTFEAIRERSGVSQGSLTHHFGSRDALIAAAHVARYERTCTADAAFLARYDGVLGTPEAFCATLIGHIDAMLSDERRTVRWIRMSAIAAALDDTGLRAVIGAAYTSLADGLTLYADEARTNGLVDADTDPRTIGLLLSMQAQGLVLDDLLESDGTSDVPVEAWNRMMVRFLACFLTPPVVTELERQASARYGDLWRAEVFGAPGRIPAEVSRRLASLRPGGTDGAEAQRDTEALRHILRRAADDDRALVRRRPATRDAHEQLLAHGTDALREAGEAGIDVATIRSAVGLPASAFHRLFPSRAAFVRACRVRLEIARAVHSTARFATLVARSSDAAQMRVALERDAVRMQQSPSRRAMWQRIETLTASRTDPELRASLARIQRTTRDLLIEQVCLAQARGLIDPALPSRAVARLLDATVFWHVFHELDERRPERQQWIAMLRRIATLLSPDDAGVTAPA